MEEGSEGGRWVFHDTEHLSMALLHTDVSAMQLTAGAFHARLRQCRVGNWTIQHLDFLAGTSTCSGSAAPDRHAFIVPLAIGDGCRLLGKDLGQDEVGIYAPGSEHADVSTSGLSEVILMPPSALMDEAAERGEAVRLPKSGSVVRAIPAPNLRRLRLVLQQVCDAAPTLADDPRLVHAMADVLELNLLAAVARGDDPPGKGRTPLPRQVVLRRLADALQEANAEPLYASDLARLAGVSYPTLRRVFLEWFGTSPVQYLMLKRLYLVRRRLLSGDYRTVVDAAMSCGFWELGRFSSRYRQLFGELPSHTLMRTAKRVGSARGTDLRGSRTS